MNHGQSKEPKWPAKKAILLSESQNLHIVIKDMCRPMGWTISETVRNIHEVITKCSKGSAYIIIIDSTNEHPAFEMLLKLQQNPVTCATPILCLVPDYTENQIRSIKHLGNVVTSHKPISVSSFVPQFSQLVAKSESTSFTALRMALYQLIHKGPKTALQSILKLHNIHELQSYTASIIAYFFKKNKNIVEAEKILLNTLKQHPSELSVITSLSNLYITHAMPHVSFNLLSEARKIYGDTEITIPGLIQSSLLMNNLAQTKDLLLELKANGYDLNRTNVHLAKVLMAMGREREANDILSSNLKLANKLRSHWYNETKSTLQNAV